jgi:hypothetical protein
MLLHRYLFSTKDGFFDDSSDYNLLKQRLIRDLTPYCKISAFVQKKIQESISVTGSGTNSLDQLNKIYKDVYSCKDALASSRQTCLIPNNTMVYRSCDTYINLPDFTRDGSCEIALMNITNDLPERIQRENEWFVVIIQKLQEAVNMAQNPSSAKPPSDEELQRYQKFNEGFTGSCSPDAVKARIAQKLAQENANSPCSIPSLSSEIARVNSLLDSKTLKNSVSNMNGLMVTVTKLENDIEAVKAQWGDNPKKVYPKFEGGDRTDSFIFSLKQNR